MSSKASSSMLHHRLDGAELGWLSTLHPNLADRLTLIEKKPLIDGSGTGRPGIFVICSSGHGSQR